MTYTVSDLSSGDLISESAWNSIENLEKEIKDGGLDTWTTGKTLVNAIMKDGSVAFTGNQSMGGSKLTSLGAPTSGSDAATKTYVDGLINGLNWQEAVLDKDLTAPPGGESVGDRYIVGGSATGGWVGQDDDIAEVTGTGPTTWNFTTAVEGMATWVQDENFLYVYNASSNWVKFGGVVDHANLQNLNWAAAGHSIDTDIVMVDNSITGVDTIAFTDVAGTLAGIQNQNLLDKTQAETITGVYTIDQAGLNINLPADDTIEIDGSTNQRTVTTGVMRFLHTPAMTGTRAITFAIDVNSMADTRGLTVDFTGTALAAGEVGTPIEINVDTADSTGGIIEAISVNKVGAGSAAVHAIHVRTGVEVIHQTSGTFGNMDTAFTYDGSYANVTAAFTSTGTDVQMFVSDNDYIYIGHSTTFSEISVILAIVAANPGVKPTFEFSIGGSSWTAFGPNDNTNGFRTNGSISWTVSDLSGWATDTVNSVSSKYWIRIQRTANSLTPPPTEDIIQISSTTEYEWDENGSLTINALATNGDVTLANATGIVVGHSTQIACGEVTSEAQVLGTSEPDASIVIGLWNTTNALSPIVKFVKSGSGTIGVSNYVTVANNEEIGKVQAYGADGADLDTLIAEIGFFVDDASVAAGQIGGEIILSTATSGGTLTTAVTISSAQLVTLAGVLDMGGNNVNNAVLVSPTIADFTNATHAHAAAGSGGVVALDDIANPAGDTTFAMAAKTITFTWTASTDHGFELEASGAFTGDLVHIHQHTGNPGTVDLIHAEWDDPDVTGLKLTGSATSDIAIDVVTGIVDINGNTLQFFDAAISLVSVDGQLTVAADVEVQIDTTTLDVNAAVDISGILTMSGANVVMSGNDITGLGSAITGTKNTALTLSVPTQGADDAVGVGITIAADTGGSGGTGNAGGAISINAGDAAGSGDKDGGVITLKPGDAVNSGVAGGVLIDGTHRLYFNDIGGEYISGTGTNIEFVGGGALRLFLSGMMQLEAGTGFKLFTNKFLQFRDTGLQILSSADGQLDIDADVELEITAPIVDINASTRVDISVDLVIGGDIDMANGKDIGIADSERLIFNTAGTINVNGAHLVIDGSNNLYFNNVGGEYITGDGSNLFFYADTQIINTATNIRFVGNTNVGNTYGLIVGHTAQIAFGEITSEAQILGTTETDASLAIGLWSVTADLAPSLKLMKSASGTIGVANDDSVANNEELGKVQAYGADGTDLDTLVAEIAFNVDDGTPAAGAIGGEMILATATTGGTLTTAVTISNTQQATFAGDVLVSGTKKLYFNDIGGEYISGDGSSLTIYGGTYIYLVAGAGDLIRTANSFGILADDKSFRLGDSSDMQMIYETADANAKCIVMGLPHVTEDANNVAVLVLTDYDSLAADLGFFDGITEPTLAVTNEAVDAYVTLDAGDSNGSGLGLYFNPAADEDVNLIGLSVTGSPTVIWDNSESGIAFNRGINVNTTVGSTIVFDCTDTLSAPLTEDFVTIQRTISGGAHNVGGTVLKVVAADSATSDANKDSIALHVTATRGNAIYATNSQTTPDADTVLIDSASRSGYAGLRINGAGGRGIHVSQNYAAPATDTLVRFETISALDSTTIMEVATVGDGKLIFIDHDGDGIAIDIDTEATTADAINVQADAITTGVLARFATDSSEVDVGNLVEIINDNTSAVGNTPLMIQQDAVKETNFKIIASFAGITVYISDGTVADGNLTGVKGDICINGGAGNGNTAYCDANGQNWTEM